MDDGMQNKEFTDRKRIYSKGMMAALNHPMRVTLYDLIREGVSTTPEMVSSSVI